MEEVEYARAATIDDLKIVAQSLNEHGVEYFLIGGFALRTQGSNRHTDDIDILVRQTSDVGEKVYKALMALPDKAIKDIDMSWFDDAETIRIGDDFIVDILFKACGETYDSLKQYAITVDVDGIPIPTLSLEGLLKTKQGLREKDVEDRNIIEIVLQRRRSVESSSAIISSEIQKKEAPLSMPSEATPDTLVQYVIASGIHPHEIDTSMPGVDADWLREQLRQAASNPEGWGVAEDAFTAWGESHGVGRKRTSPSLEGPKTEIVYDDF